VISKRVNPVLFTIIYYLASIILILVGHAIEPTNLAGPGLDLIIFFVVIMCSIILLVRDCFKIKKDKAFLISAIIHFVFVAGVILVFNFPKIINK
jgi:hypothetical protein